MQSSANSGWKNVLLKQRRKNRCFLLPPPCYFLPGVIHSSENESHLGSTTDICPYCWILKNAVQ